MVTSAAVAANNACTSGFPVRAPAVRTESRLTVTRSAWAPVTSRSFSSMARPSSHRSIIMWPSLPTHSGDPARASRTAGPTPSARSRSVVQHIEMRVAEPPSRAMSVLLRWVACTAVVSGPSTPAAASSSTGVDP